MKPTDTPPPRVLKSGSFASVADTGKKSKASLATKERRTVPRTTDAQLSALPSMTATQLKRGGWPGVMVQVNKTTAVAVTNHHRTEAVILTAEHYATLVQQAAGTSNRSSGAETTTVPKEIALARLQRAFDQRLAKLKDGKSLAAATRKRARRGKVTLGTPF